MSRINLFGNKMFSLMFTWLLDQRLKDTLCGTKVLSKENYDELKRNRKYFGNFDPFGDYDLIFGAAKMALKIVEVPIRYQPRVYSEGKKIKWWHGMTMVWTIIKWRFAPV